MRPDLTRRSFVRAVAAGSAALTWLGGRRLPAALASKANKPARLGGTPAYTGSWPKWPHWSRSWEPRILDVLRSGRWSGGGGQTADFEAGYADLLGAKRCVATASGTTALVTALHVMGVDAGDEVIVSPFTFIATYSAVLNHKALPVFADTDPATLTMDPASIESRITDRTRAIVPVHIYGMPCDMNAINTIAKKHNLAVVEDACQAWLAEYQGRKCGTLADLGCFSFQNSKHLPSGEGGAITGNSDELLDRCHAYHNCGRAFGTFQGKGCFSHGTNCRMTQYQAAMLLQQFDALREETGRRRESADHLAAGLKQIPGVLPARLPENSRAVWHLFPIRYDAAQFNGLTRDDFIRALRAEGVPCGGGYDEQYYDGVLDEAITSRGFQRLFPAERLKTYRDGFQELKGNKQVCETTVVLSNTLLLADRSAIDCIIEAIAKIHAHSAALAS
ncbi:MAG: DegT/DnrJ/EryC1/StrS family aminotransferase [Rhodopirellula sp.]|nr:DegT/DnrJ/EryC1/StrS family aminotransferase [Rhodopirellula sp.]